MDVLIPILAGLAGVLLGGFLSRRNERSAHADRLLAEALNDLVSAVASVAQGDQSAQREYASAASRIALYGSPELVASLHAFQIEPNTGTDDGRSRFLALVGSARTELGRGPVDTEGAAVLLFGSERASLPAGGLHCASCGTELPPGTRKCSDCGHVMTTA